MFKKKEIQKKIVQSRIPDHILELESRILNLERPPKFKVGQKVKWHYTSKSCGHEYECKGKGVIVEYIPLKRQWEESGYYFTRGGDYRIFNGQYIVTMGDTFLDEDIHTI